MRVSAGVNKITLRKFFRVEQRLNPGYDISLPEQAAPSLETGITDTELDDIENDDIEIERFHPGNLRGETQITAKNESFIDFKVMMGDCSYRHYRIMKFHLIEIMKYSDQVEIITELDLGDYGFEYERTGRYRNANLSDINEMAIKEFLLNNKKRWKFIYESVPKRKVL